MKPDLERLQRLSALEPDDDAASCLERIRERQGLSWVQLPAKGFEQGIERTGFMGAVIGAAEILYHDGDGSGCPDEGASPSESINLFNGPCSIQGCGDINHHTSGDGRGHFRGLLPTANITRYQDWIDHFKERKVLP